VEKLKVEKSGMGVGVAEGESRKLISISDRLLNFAASVIKLTNAFPSNYAGKHIGGQLIRASSSIGANFEESRGAQSRQDYVYKLQISFKEAKETMYWLRLSQKLDFVGNDQILKVIEEGNEVQLILGKSVVTTKENSK
jgi:four helix bundle protein